MEWPHSIWASLRRTPRDCADCSQDVSVGVIMVNRSGDMIAEVLQTIS